MEITELSRDNYHLIEKMWERLKRLHGELSCNFKSHFESVTFEKRMRPLLEKDALSVFVATEHTELAGYCMVSAEDGTGEIDSIYIEPAHRKKGIGSAFMEKAMDWLHDRGCDSVSISVADGNEGVLDFYRNFGFQKYAVVLKNVKAPSTVAQ